MPEKIFKVLYLDSDYYLTLSNRALVGIRMEVVVEVPPDSTTERYAQLLPEGITVLTDRPLVYAGRKSVYDPTPALLRFIASETTSGRYDWVIIGNNRGAGLSKGRQVAEPMRERTLIIANSYPVEDPYRLLGFQHFASRDAAGNLLARLITEGRD